MSPLEIRSTYSAATFRGPMTASRVSLTPFDDLPEVPLMFGRIRPRRELAFHRRLREQVGIGHQRVDRVDALVQVVLDLVEVAVVIVGDLRRYVALGNPVHILGGHVQRSDDRVQGLVDAFHDLLKSPWCWKHRLVSPACLPLLHRRAYLHRCPFIEIFLTVECRNRDDKCVHAAAGCRRPGRGLRDEDRSVGRGHVDTCCNLAPAHTKVAPAFEMHVGAAHRGELFARPFVRLGQIGRTGKAGADVVKEPRRVLHDARVGKAFFANTGIHGQVEGFVRRLSLHRRGRGLRGSLDGFLMRRCEERKSQKQNGSEERDDPRSFHSLGMIHGEIEPRPTPYNRSHKGQSTAPRQCGTQQQGGSQEVGELTRSVYEAGPSPLSLKSATRIDLVILSEVRRVGRSRRTCIQGMRLCRKSMTQETNASLRPMRRCVCSSWRCAAACPN